MASIPARTALRRVLQGTAALGALALGNSALAQEAPRPTGVIDAPGIVVRNDLNPNTLPPTGVLDPVDITGVGQVTVDQGGGFVGLCTGTLINPRTVILAAHCVNDAPAASYGSATGGTGISVGFKMDNRPALISWLNSGHATNTANALYNVEQVWYDPRSTTPSAASFLEGDVALATLDTPATGIPTWTMLFSPLTEETHAVVTGYGNRGTSATGEAGIDFRRRVAENMLSVLGSLDDRNDWLFGPAPAENPQSLYMLDFDSPAGEGAFNTATGNYDFDLFDGGALPREGTTGGGDSGGPLIVDQAFDKPVVVGVLSGGSRFFANQKFSTYGTHSFYQPLFLFWDAIVANNSYVYASNRAGIRDWTDPNHWVQTMDPNYGIIVNGELVNGLPDTPALGVSGNTPKFGSICFLSDCTDLADDPEATPPATGNGTPVYIPGGPGTRNFVPNNVVANPTAGVKARYYDVTLSAIGATSLGSNVTIDRLTVDGTHLLDVRKTGQLQVLTDFTQWAGWTNVDGLLRSREALVASGILSGSGTVDPTYLTIGKALVAPGGSGIGTLTIQGDLILSSGALLSIDLSRTASDKLVVTGDALNPGIAALDGTVLFNRGSLLSTPRHGQSFTFLTASGGVDGTFAHVASTLGLLRAEVVYDPNAVRVNLKAGSIFDYLRNAGELVGVFANALDALRDRSYSNLSNLYGSIDLMEPDRLASTLRGLNPGIVGESRSLQERQSTIMLNAVTDRLSMLGTGRTGGQLSIVGTPDALGGLTGLDRGESAARSSAVRSMLPSTTSIGRLPENISGFISGGFIGGQSSYGVTGQANGQHSWYVGMGMEMDVAPYTTLGTAVGFSEGTSRPGVDRAEADTRVSQIAVYGSHRLGGGVYLAGLGMAEQSRTGLRREASTGDMAYSLAGNARVSRYAARAEMGVNLPVAKQLSLTPRVSLGYSSYAFKPFRESGGELALQIDRMRAATFEGRAGVQVAGSARMGSWTLVPQLTGDYVRTLAGDRGSLVVRFASAPEAAMLLPMLNGDAAWGEVRGGLRLVNGPLEFGAGIERRIGRTLYRDDRAVLDARFRF
ncbi:autotransporter domain-containing protein [Sphingomonas sp. UNC305MFCol5.2]|uniref:autotransporter domain-containing protein n=1 Tax=Sphingomonas sp. UNC305MFCol5.2 TaxID=1449076 RepID=UPI0004A7381F|nr:autotransporter domain-containing protein [Sphingomonas sp. UNC305MFCol5.2]